MASTLAPLSPIPTPQQPLFDVRTGLMNRDWYLWFQRLYEHMKEIEQRLDAGGL